MNDSAQLPDWLREDVPSQRKQLNILATTNRTLQTALEHVREHEAALRLNGEQPQAEDDPGTQLLAICQDTIAKVKHIRSHTCQFGDDGCCPVCGLDGRAHRKRQEQNPTATTRQAAG